MKRCLYRVVDGHFEIMCQDRGIIFFWFETGLNLDINIRQVIQVGI